jgi:hypothetical protein
MHDDQDTASNHYLHSVLRERIVEHVFVGDVLRQLWLRGVTDVEVLRSEFDAGGYDLVMGHEKVVRHVQFKTVSVDGKAARVSINMRLAEKPSGCVIWIVVNPDLSFDSYLWFGGLPGQPLPDISGFKVTKHTKGNAEGIKLERPNHRIIPRGSFERITKLDVLLERMFGELS